MAVAESPEERETVPSQLSKKTKTQKRKITHRDSERDRFDSLTWNSSLSVNEDNEHFSSLFIGSGELDGGFLSLEEIDEADYSLEFPKSEREKPSKIPKSKKQKHGEDGDKRVAEVVNGGITEKDGKEENLKTKKKKKKKKKEKESRKKKKSSSSKCFILLRSFSCQIHLNQLFWINFTFLEKQKDIPLSFSPSSLPKVAIGLPLDCGLKSPHSIPPFLFLASMRFFSPRKLLVIDGSLLR
ncbi:DEAD-box ATP-dependent RNA helicase 13-like [Carica papaya]|uniref:DEAD-box ATP-dependent RNA helicase 13-like n=1 Tax=Carica papaya TaxID=3649 RepID=UPI000B8CA25C|nr:DEAD-box ATP-dependent RNA helicase 13-like [Carica papaya]